MKNNQLTLSNFEQNLDSRILERGLEYYQDGNILTIEEVDKGLWEAIIKGSDNYEITVHLQNDIITNSSCNCPYDMGNHCKHEVAIFNFLKYSDLAKKEGSNKMEKVRTIVEQFSPKEMKDNLLEILKMNRAARNGFLEEYDD